MQVAPIPGQSGWLVRNKLVDRLGAAGHGQPAYRLDVTLDENITSFGLRGDQRRDAGAANVARSLSARRQPNGMVVLDATAGSDAGIDIVSSEYATVAAEQTALEQLADKVADQIVARLGVYANAHRAGEVKAHKAIDRPGGRSTEPRRPLLSVPWPGRSAVARPWRRGYCDHLKRDKFVMRRRGGEVGPSGLVPTKPAR